MRMWSVKKLNDNSAICVYNCQTDKTFFIARESLNDLVNDSFKTVDDIIDLCEQPHENYKALEEIGLFNLLVRQ